MNDATTITQLTEQPSKTLDEAIDRLSATALARIDELTKQRDAEGVRVITLTRQRDELAACLREARRRIIDGPNGGDFATQAFNDANLLNRAQAALLRLDVRERLDDKLQAERAIADEGRRCPTCGQKLP